MTEKRPLVVPVTSDGVEWLTFHAGTPPTGWAIFQAPGYGLGASGKPYLFVRFAVDRGRVAEPTMVDGHPGVMWRDAPELDQALIVAREVLVSFDKGLGPRAMRDLPLTRLEAAVNQPAYRRAVLEHADPENSVMVPFPWNGSDEWWFAGPEATQRPAPRRRPRLRLRVPDGRSKPDSFYEQVAERFAFLATTSKRPAQDLAEANDVKATTVHGWVKEARRRGLLPPGERSRRLKGKS